jgi:hypothetical protein
MKLKLLAAAVIAAMSSTASFAVTTVWGAHDTVELGSVLLSPGPFLDYFTFLIGSTSSLSSTAVAANVSISVPVSMNILDISGGTYSLWSMGADNAIGGSGVNADTSMSAWVWNFNGGTGNTSNSVTPLLAGGYYYAVGGMAAGTAGGQYTLVSTVTAVPEPETYAMMLAGLGALGFLARRRRND